MDHCNFPDKHTNTSSYNLELPLVPKSFATIAACQYSPTDRIFSNEIPYMSRWAFRKSFLLEHSRQVHISS